MRGVLAFDASPIPLPDAVVLDTSFVVDAMLTGQRRHTDANAYLLELAIAGTGVFFNRLLELELAEAAYKIAMKERFGNRRAAVMRTDGRALRRASRLVARVTSAWHAVLDSFSWGVVELSDVAGDVPVLMRRGLSSYDAVHAQSAISLGVRHLVTTDCGFGLVAPSDLTIVTHSSLLTATRRYRTRTM